MTAPSLSRHISEFPRPVSVSFATLRWISEEEVTDEPWDDDEYSGDQDSQPSLQEKDMFDVVGEQYRLESVEAAALAVAEQDTYLPARYWLLCEDDNPHDANAVSVHAVVDEFAYQVGFLPRHEAEAYRLSLVTIGRPNETIEVLGCFTQGKDKPHANCRLFLPYDFAKQLRSGIADNPDNNPAWLRDPSPVQPRSFQGENAAGFSDDELRKIFCRFAKRKRWFGLPNHCDAAVEGYRSRRMSEELEEFLVSLGSESPVSGLSVSANRSLQVTELKNNPPSREKATRGKGSKSRPKPHIVAEEQIELDFCLLEREDPRDYEGSLGGSVLLTMVRRTSRSDEHIDREGILRFEITDDRKRRPTFHEVDLADLYEIVEAICDAVLAVAMRPSHQAKASLIVPLSKKLSIAACTGERVSWTFRASRVQLFLHADALRYLIIREEALMHALAQAAGGDQRLQDRVTEAVTILQMPIR